MSNPWFRMYNETVFNPKVQILSEALQRRYVMLLCLHCNGKLVEQPEDEIILALRITEEEWKVTKETLIKRDLLLENLEPKGWAEKQYVTDLKDPTNKERQKRYRDNKRNGGVTVQKRPDTDTDTDTERKKDTKKDSVEFDYFWELYGNKVDRKKTEEKFYAALKKTEYPQIIAAAEAYSQYCKTTAYPKKNPQTWLNGECWNNDYKKLTEQHNATRIQGGKQRHSGFAGQDYTAGTAGFIVG